MKRASINWISAAGFLAGLLIIMSINPMHKESRRNPDERGMSDAMSALNDWSRARSYPDADIPPDKYYRAFLASKSDLKSLSRGPLAASIWTPIGPLENDSRGRAISVAVNPVNTNTLYCGTASGGLWRSRRATIGGDWRRMTLGYPALGIGSITIDPADTNTMYVGTGEVYRYGGAVGGLVVRTTRGSYGVGILKSTDGGFTWSKSLDWSYNQQRGVQQVRINPKNHNTLFAATSEGVYRSIDRGGSWNPVLDVIMATDVVINSVDTTLLLAACGNFSSPGYGIYRSTDAGASWARIPGGQSNYSGKTLLEMFAANPFTVYASVADSTTGIGGLWRSTDFGSSWTLISNLGIFGVQGWYSHFVSVHATDSTQVVHAGLNAYKSANGGVSFFGASGGYSDNHNYAHDPIHPAILYIVNDNGIFYSPNFGNNFVNIGNGMQTLQFYNGFSSSATDSVLAVGQVQDHIPGYIYRGLLAWNRPAGTDEVGWTAINQSNDTIMYAVDRMGSNVFKSINRGASFTFRASFGGTGSWNTPLVLSKSNPSVLYVAKSIVYRSGDAAGSWFASNGGISLDGNPGLAIAMSGTNPGVVFVGTVPYVTRAHVFRTTNSGASWTNVTGVLPDRYPMDLAVNSMNDNTVYATFGGFGTGHVFKSTDRGSTWVDITGSLPDVPTPAILIDPLDTNTVFCGNDIGVYVSTNGGATWSGFSEGLPEAVICADLSLNVSSHTLRVATHGNGVYERRIGVAGLFDYRPLSFESPSDGAKILAGSTISGITASIQNSGSIAQTDSFDVTYRILKGSTELFSSTRRIAGLDQSETREVSFEGNFTPLDSGLHVLQLISLAADQISFNDTLTGLLTVVLSSPIASARVTKLGCPYAEISGGSPGPSGDDRQAAIPLPFRLTYDGHTYDSLQLSTNGWIELGTGTSGSLYGLSTPAQIGPAGASNNGRLGTIQRPTKALGPWWEDLSTGFSGTIGEVSYKTLDSAPNRIFVVQWKNMLAFFDSTTTTTRINFQLRLYETSNVIEYHYGPVIAGTFGGSGAGASLGLKDHIGGDYHFYDIARNGTAAAADVITYLNPLTGWPGQDSCYRIENVVTAVSDMNAPQLPSQIYLGQNYPNPFNPKTNFGFRIVDFGLVTLKVYDVLGREVATIVNEVLPPGHYSRTWDATDAASGIYLYKMRAGSFNETKKMMLIR